MKLGTQSQTLIDSALKRALKKLVAGGEQVYITDIHLQPCQESGELLIFDDEDNELARVDVKEWADCDSDTFYGKAESQLSPLVGKLKNQGLLETLPLMKPYSFVLVDEEHESIADLLLVDDDTMLLNDELLKGLDKEDRKSVV